MTHLHRIAIPLTASTPSRPSSWLSVSQLLLIFLCFASFARSEDWYVHEFARQRLTGTYYSEGVAVGDLNQDGHPDIVYGPHWYAGPDFTAAHEIYPAVPQNREGYADHFFAWTTDFNGDALLDILVVGFPGTPAYVYENPGVAKHGQHWPKHEVFDWVSNESPQWTQLVGDPRPELVCTRDGFFGYVTPNWNEPFNKWTFTRVSEQTAARRFGHGLGVGDVNSDQRADILTQNGWFEQPTQLGRPWAFHEFLFTRAGGADMFAYDVDGDGDNDVITSLEAHSYGLAWFEQIEENGQRTFRRHVIMGSKREDSNYGTLFTEPHSVNLADMDGDGLLDICTGKTFYSHHKQSPLWDAGAVVYWFKLVRNEDGTVDWLPFQADDQAGIGRQLVVADVNQDQLPDLVAGGMLGCHVMTHARQAVDKPTWQTAQPRPFRKLQAGLTPDQAAQQMTVPPGFHVQLAAGEPQVHQPIAFTFDHRGRVWVAEAYNYPLRAPAGEGKDKIVILEDTDHDGTLDSRKEFATGLNLVSGLEVGFGGVWVGAAPYLMFIPDKDGDDLPDSEPQILLDGFGYQDTHETLNAFIWGPDGWLYGCHGVFTHSRVGKPGTPDDRRVPMNAAVWRYHPTRHVFDVFARGTSNPWGVDFNDHGQAFMTACVIPHLWHVIQGARYQRQGGQHFNPHLYDDIKTIADHSHYTGNIRDSAWWGHEPELSDSVSLAGGGHAHCGAMIYLADNWPASYRDSIYFHNIHGNRVNNDILERQGSGYVGHHGDDFLMANDKWFRGINLKYGPDGSVHLIDWYDKNACHRTNPTIWDRSNGRIYRVRYGEVSPPVVDLSQLSDLELAKLQSHANEWYVRMARRLLQERAAAGKVSDPAIAELKRQLAQSAETPQRLRALWGLHCIGAADRRLLSRTADTDDEYLKAWSIQLAIPEVLPGKAAPRIRRPAVAKLIRLAHDSSPLVRLYVASALQRISLEQRWDVAEALLQQAADADDHNLPLMIWYGVEPIVLTDVPRALNLAARAKVPLVSRFIVRRAAGHNDSLPHVLATLPERSPAQTRVILEEVLRAFEGRVDIPMPDAWQAAYEHLLKSGDATIRDQADRVAVALGDRRILPRMREILSDPGQPLDRRQRAFGVIQRGRDPEAAPALLSALSEPALRGPAIRALAAYDHPDVASQLLSLYATLDEAERRDVMGTLTSRPAYALALLDAMQNEDVPRTDLHAYHVRQLQSLNQATIIERLRSVWGTIRESSADTQQQIQDWKQRLTADALAKADFANGRQVFDKTCGACHKLFGNGGTVGPDITGSNRANLDYILENLVDPSAVVSKDYRMSTLALDDGRVITGLILKESDSALTVRTVNDTLLVAKAEVEDRSRSELSLMPAGQLDQLTAAEARDLIAYLASPAQVALPKRVAPIDSQTGKAAGAIEAETMKVIGKTSGNVSAQAMGSFTADKWSDSRQLWWTGQKQGAQLDLEFAVAADGAYRLEVVLTRARDYGIVQMAVDDVEQNGPIDCYVPNRVDTTGLLDLGTQTLKAGKHQLSVKVIGKNSKSSNTMVGIDYLRATPVAN